jgi:hypothetical protein
VPQSEVTMTRTEGLLALLVLHSMADASLLEKTVALDRAGLKGPEISQLLGVSVPSVTQSLYMARKAAKKTKKAPAKKAAAKKASARVSKAKGR